MLNESKLFYSASNNGFFASDINEKIPNDAIEINAELYAELLQKQSSGFVIQSDENGYPVAVERVLSADDSKSINESKQQKFIIEANEKIAVLQDSIDLDMQEFNEEEQLKQWKKYRILVTRVDTNANDIEWPEKPK